MAGNNNIVPLHKTVHWRNLKTIIKESFCQIYESNSNNESIDNLDLNHIICYRCKGINMQGMNVEFLNDKNRSCFVADNNYEVFEVKENNTNFNGESYIVFAHDIDFDYWIICSMKITNTIENGKYYRNVNLHCVYDGAITLVNDKYMFTKETSIYAKCRGNNNEKVYFDSEGARTSAYGKTYSSYLKEHYGKQKTIVDNKSVKIYKKNNKKGQK